MPRLLLSCVWFAFLLPFVYCFAQENPFDGKDAKVLYPGIKHIRMEVNEPRIMKINAVQIDLKTEGLSFYTTPADPDAGKPMPDSPKYTICTKRQKTRDFMRQCRKPVAEGGKGMNMVVASNTNGWRPWEPPWNQKYGCDLGLIVSEGKVVSPCRAGASFIVYKDGTVDMKTAKPGFDTSNVAYAVTGFAFVLVDGVCSGDKSLHPRTGYGLSEDKRYLVILTIDGRQQGYSEGATTKEVGEWLKTFGCHTGINMDGGGSTTLAYWDKEKNDAVQLNHQKGGAERSVGCSMGFILNK